MTTPEGPMVKGRLLGRRRRFVALAALGAALVVAVPIAWASHQFTDVPDSNPFHADISAIAGAGITGGKTCVPPGTPPTYCPNENVTRQAMAAFMSRGFGRVAQGSTLLRTTLTEADGFPDIGSVSINVGGVSGSQFVIVQGIVGIAGTGADCPCNLQYALREQGAGASAVMEFDQIPITGYNQQTLHVQHVFVAAPGVHTYVMWAFISTSATFTLRQLRLIATTAPLGSGVAP